jgi:lipopolysaccharide transport system ATP-binding protein
MASVVSVRNVSKRYRHASLRTRTLKDLVTRSRKDARRREFWALRDVSFEIARGQTLGVIGPNGAGKSTLLRLLAGIGLPDTGEISVRDRVSGIFELGAGFHQDLTGRESVVLTGVIAGLTRAQIRNRLPEIAAFAELETFLDDPVRTYSSGMVARLAFAIAVHVDASVLLVDEAIAVGDLAFQQRCFDRLKEFQRSGVTMVVVSHSPAALRELSDEVIWLQSGEIVARGRPDEVSGAYASKMRELAHRVTPVDLPVEVTAHGLELRPGTTRLGSQEARVTDLRIVDRWGESVVGSRITGGDLVRFIFEIEAPSDLGDVNLAVHVIRDDDGVLCVNASTTLAPNPSGRRRAHLECSRLDLAPGKYACEVGLYSADWSQPYDYHSGVYAFTVDGEVTGRGVLAPPMMWHRDSDDSDVASGR